MHASDKNHRNMFPAALDIVRILPPLLVVFENVPGLIRPSFAPIAGMCKGQLVRDTGRQRWWWRTTVAGLRTTPRVSASRVAYSFRHPGLTITIKLCTVLVTESAVEGKPWMGQVTRRMA